MANQRYLKYGIVTLLSVTALVASILAGYQKGFAVGKSDGIDAKIINTSYYVGPLLVAPDAPANAKPDYKSLVNLITSAISPDTWRNPDTSIEPHPSSHILLVSQTAACHAQIEDFLKKLEEAKKQAGLSELNDQRIENGQCVLCGHGTFKKMQTFSSKKFYRPQCCRCGHIAPWLEPLNDTSEPQKASKPAG